ncbi:MAG TPA: AP2 domain-containing protein [Thermoanaerobaculia bacterium]
MKKKQRIKGVTRIDDPGGHGVGWYARVVFQGKTHSKYFADGAHGGTRAALRKAVTWRDAQEKKVGKPRTNRLFPSTSTRSRTGVQGVYQSKTSFVVAWSPAPGEIRREFISISRYGKKEALRRAIKLRRSRERAVYGRAVGPRARKRR